MRTTVAVSALLAKMKGRLRLFPRAALSTILYTPRSLYQLRKLSTPLEDEKKEWNWVPPRQQQTSVVNETEMDTKLEVIQGWNHLIIHFPYFSSLFHF
jgi:hypothetical protein